MREARAGSISATPGKGKHGAETGTIPEVQAGVEITPVKLGSGVGDRCERLCVRDAIDTGANGG